MFLVTSIHNMHCFFSVWGGGDSGPSAEDGITESGSRDIKDLKSSWCLPKGT